MNVYNAKRLIQEIENELKYLYELREIAFESTQPKSSKFKEIMVQGSNNTNIYRKLENEIDEIEPRIKTLETMLKPLKNYVKRYYEILQQYDPVTKKIIQLREEQKLTWQEISEACNYSEKSCRNKHDEFKRKNI